MKYIGEREWKVQHGIPGMKWKGYGFRVLARTSAEAAHKAEELAFAVAWHRGTLSKVTTPREPEPWAIAATSYTGQIKVV